MQQDRRRLLVEARSWIGTPEAHQGRLKGVGCDCLGLVIETGRLCGLIADYAYPPYGRLPQPGALERELAAITVPIPRAAALAGDIALIRWRRLPMHLALLGDFEAADFQITSLIHAALELGGVVEHRLDAAWSERIVSIHRLKGLI